jgi:3-phenylpropionate/cinnamic acid dioxygenase small subunit
VTSEDLRTVGDKLEIHELLARYARAVDTKDFDLWCTVFTPDAHVDYRSAGGIAGSRDEVAAWLAKSLAAAIVPMTQHLITNIEVELDGDRASVVALFFNPMQVTGATALSYYGGRYVHDMVRTSDGWKSARLVEHTAWSVNPPGG